MPLLYYILNCLEILLINQAKLINEKKKKETFLVGLVHQFVFSSKKKKEANENKNLLWMIFCHVSGTRYV